MFAKFRKSFFFSLKNFVQRYQITVINASVTVILIVIVIFVLLNRASSLQRKTAEESIVNLAGMTANEVQSYVTNYFEITRTISQIMQNYQNIVVNQRRNFMNDTMLALLSSNRALVSIYSLWKPNQLDGMDAAYANALGSDETGQFISGFTRERGWIEQKAFGEYKYLLNEDSPNMGPENNSTISAPSPRFQWGRNIFVIDIRIPIVEDFDTVGVVGVSINLEQLQFLIEPIRPYGTGQTMVCTTSGMIIAHNNGNLRGLNFLGYGSETPLFPSEIYDRVFQAINTSIENMKPSVLTTKDALLVSYPLRTSSVLTSYYSYTAADTVPWAVLTIIPLSTILAPINALLRFSVLFTIGAGVLMAFVVFLTSSSITQRARLLQRDLERATTMQDNLKYGLFLIDQKYIIQEEYSKALEKILAISDLQGKDFLEILGSSLKPHEKQGLKDYLEMVFKRSFDQEMLESINPINVFSYVSTTTKEMKSLRTNFTLAERADYILVTLEDITAEKQLEKQLLDAQNLREKEMQSLFQVIQLNPRVLSDFIEDTEYEFDKINEMLKNKTHFHREVLVEMYQSIHAIKSNALILNLENFSNTLHTLEASIKELQDKYEDFVPFDDFLSLVLELDEAMKEKDELKVAISRIQNFKSLSGEDKSQERYVLVETLTQVCNKTREALNKKVRLVVDSIDEPVLNYGPRRVIKEVLTQLVRNAVYHGIETPEDRKSAGKEPEGEIRVSLRYRDNQIVIKETDNGRGIDFGKIRQTAEAFNLFSNPDEINDRNFLLNLLFSPGFSTLDTADLHAGRGMGLNLVKDRVKELHGNLKISTAPGRGTTFTIAIPLEIPELVISPGSE